MDSTFKQKVFDIVRNIPRGSVMTYGEVAAAAGHPGAARAVGTIMKSNYDPAIPCHRVIRANGTPGYYNRGNDKKVELLTRERTVTNHWR